jgi:tRNA modification GTPase
MPMMGETIVAIATPEGSGGLSVVRLSGPDALVIAGRVFRPGLGSKADSHRAVYGILVDPRKKNHPEAEHEGTIDQVIALPMIAPKSFTGEDTVEFFCHGGAVVSRLVVSACRAAGARPATAGEFTRRAFLNGKMSLDQAEAVADLIHAESEMAARAAIRQLLGGLNRQLVEIESPLLDLLARLEGGLEFVEEEVAGVDPAVTRNELKKAVSRIAELLEMAPAGRLLRDGIHVVLQGEPNVGKSSLFNQLVEQERAIVDEEAGTTRDVVSARVVKKGRVFVFHDTAGLRETSGRIENKGIERTREAVRQADIVLSLRLASDRGTSVVDDGGEAGATAVLPVWTKSDLLSDNPEEISAGGEIFTSSLAGVGISRLWTELDRCVEEFELAKAVSLGVVINERHRHKLEHSRTELAFLLGELEDPQNLPGDEVVGTLLASILAQLGEISGRVFSEQILESVFSRFCVGK